MVSDAISCPLHNLKTVWNIIMILLIQLCRTGHDDASRTRMTTLILHFVSYFPLMISDAISCPLLNLKTVWNIFMILHSYVEQAMDDVSHIRMASLTVILSELFSLDQFRCNFISVL